MSTLHIAVDVTPIQPGGECGGAKPFVLQLLKDLAAAPRRHEYVLLTAGHNHDLFASHEAQNVARRRIDTVDPASAGRQLGDSGIDLLFCPMTAPTYATDGIATVSILYDLQHLAYPTFFKAEELMHRARFYQDLVRRVDHVVCISEYSRASLIEHLHVPRERTSVVPIAIQDRLPHFDATAAWEILISRGLRRCRYAFYPANFWPHKNHRMLLLAFARFIRERPDADLHLVLTGDLLDQGDAIRAAVQRMGLASHVHLMGFVPEADLGALWSAASFLVFPSLFEGFGIPLTEAMSFGLPILCSQQGSLPEVAGDTAVYFDARDPQAIVNALALAWDEPQEPRCVGLRAQERLSAFRPDVVVEQYLDVFDRTMAQSLPRVSSAGQYGSPQLGRVQARAVARLHSGRNLYQAGRPLRGVLDFALGALVAPRHAGHLLKGALKPLVFEARTRLFGRRGLSFRAETEGWSGFTGLHGDGWVGPTLALSVDWAPGHTRVVLKGKTKPSRFNPPLEIEALIGGESLGTREVGRRVEFELVWNLPQASGGRQRLQLVANSFMVPHDYFGNHDYRPLSYHLTSLEIEGDGLSTSVLEGLA